MTKRFIDKVCAGLVSGLRPPYDEERPADEGSQEFVAAFMETVGQHFTPRDRELLICALQEEQEAWRKAGSRDT